MKSALLGVALVTGAPLAFPQLASFDTDTAGQAPAGWTCGSTGKGSPKWLVQAAFRPPSPPHVLRQAGKTTFSRCVNKTGPLTHGRGEGKCKPLSGREDQRGGLV